MANPIGRMSVVAVLALMVLGWLAAHTDIFFADGLRYISQARALASGSADAGWRKAVDHPAYPAMIALSHTILGGDSPAAWQSAAQLASILAGVLLIIPLYLVSRELFGARVAFLAGLLLYLLPLTGHVFADTLSESTFLLFWTWGLWGALRFFRSGSFGWAGLVAVMAALAYLSRPEGLLLPAAVATTLILCPRWVAGRLGRRGLIGVGAMVVGLVCLVAPYVATRGGLATKPSIARLLGTAGKSPAHAVERARPLDESQTVAETYLVAVKAVWKAIHGALTLPLTALAILGLVVVNRQSDEAARQWRLLLVIGAASILALIRLHATGGYCSPRHALILVLIAVPAAAFGLDWLLKRWVTDERVRRLGWVVALIAMGAWNGRDLLAPINEGMNGYREAGAWLAAHETGDGPIVDVTGWSQYYGRKSPGYTFANLYAASTDSNARWVVAREAHLIGPWEYCQQIRALVDGLEPTATFVGMAGHRPTRVFIFDRGPLLAAQAATGAVRR